MSPKRRRRTLVAIVIGTVLAIAVGATAIVVTRGDHASAHALTPATTTTRATTTTTTKPKPTTTTAPAPLPQPTPPPADAYANVPIYQIGTIEIPKIGLVHPIFEGVWLTVVDHGPGHAPGSAMPGKAGNSVFAGHRVTHTHPFLDLDLLAPGNHVIFDMPNGKFTYEITSITIVQPEDLGITTPTRQPTITLFACNPKHSAAQRIVVKGKLITSQPKSVKT
jgi:LPXTG-site transpeptidase (sortase) family protein